jgi:hypothetical protein
VDDWLTVRDAIEDLGIERAKVEHMAAQLSI